MSFPSSRTQPAFRLGWAGRNFASLGAIGGLLAMAISSLVADGLKDVSPLKAITQYGLPTGLCVSLAAVLLWILVVYLPRERERETDERRQIYGAHEDRVNHLREVMETAATRAEERDIRKDHLFEDTLTRLLESHSEDRKVVQRLEERLGTEVRAGFERLNDRFEALTTGQRAKIAVPR